MIPFLVACLLLIKYANAATTSLSAISPTNANDYFGRGVYYDNGYLAVIAPNAEHGGTDVGYTQFYTWGGSSWTAGQKLVHNTAASGNSAALDGGMLVLASAGNDNVDVYTESGGTFSYVETLTSPTSPGIFGRALSLDKTNNRLVILDKGTTGTDERVEYYTWGGSSWSHQQTITISTSDTLSANVLLKGDNLFVGFEKYDGSFGGEVLYYKRTGTGASTWTLHRPLRGDTGLPPDGTWDFEYFGYDLALDGDYLAITALTYSIADAIQIFKNNGTDFEYLDRIGSSGVSAAKIGRSLAFKDGYLIAGTDTNYRAFYSKRTGDTFSTFTELDPDDGSMTNSDFGRWEGTSSVVTAENQFVVGASRKDSFGKAYSFDIPTPSPTTSPTLSPTQSPVVPTAEPTASPTPDSGIIISKANVLFRFKNDTDRLTVINDIISQINAEYPDTSEYTIKENVLIEESGTITEQIITEIGNNTLLIEKLKEVRCGSAADYCTIVINGGRRLLSGDRRELLTNVPIEIEFDLDSSLMSLVDGTNLEDSNFEQALATALGTNTDNILITSNGGDVTVTATLTALPSPDPLGESLVQIIENLQTELTNITTTLVNDLGVSGDSVLSSTIDLCPVERDCNGNGSCDDSTGLCTCVGNWWGINCETACTCVNDGECINALCHCEYPYYGLRCNSTIDCTC